MVVLESILVQPIGFVKNSLGRRPYDKWRDTESEIVLSVEYQDALYRLDEFSHIEVIFHLNEMNESFVTRTHPRGDPEIPERGVFATRTPNRPSRLGLTTCRLLSIDGNRLKVKGLDAYDGSPVLDIKPYMGKTVEEVKVPEWV
jgi:tRNA-Thr(GGU) m(6)t(6)A37 methyltransferase TsaA